MPDRDDDRPRRRYDNEDDYPRRRRRDEVDDDYYDRPRRRAASGSNGMAVTSLVLGILSLFCFALTGLPAIVFGFLGLSKASRVGTGKGMAVAGLLLGLLGTVLTAGAAWVVWKGYKGAERVVKAAKEEAEVEEDRESGIEVAQAANNYENAVGTFPNPYRQQVPGFVPPKGKEPPKPLLSWRVDLLPYLGEPEYDALHRRFQREQPWDSQANRPLARERVEPYVLGYDPPGAADTRWRGFTGPGAVFEPGARVTIAAIPDGTSNTLLFVESAEAVRWTEPNDYPFSNPNRPVLGPKGPTTHPLPTLGRPGARGFLMAMCDGSVKYVRKTIDPKTMAMLIDRADGNVIPQGWEIMPNAGPFDD
jgi:hypothetical protein